MKDLILVRHAKSSWRDPSLDDHSRPLNKRGKRDAPEMGDRMARRGYGPDLLISSSAVRAVETARTIAGKLGYPRERIQVEKLLYLSGVDVLLEVVRSVDAPVQTLMLFGHNPGFTDLANLLGPRDILNMPTCGVLHLRFDTATWNAIGQVAGEEVLYDFPKSVST